MFKLFSKGRLSALLALTLSVVSSSLMAWDCCEASSTGGRFYVGGFGGGIWSDKIKVDQQGTAFFTEAAGGPLAVYAQGRTKRKSTGFGGAQIGYAWSNPCGCSDWTLASAGEIEAYFFSQKRSGHLINPTTRLPEHDFVNSFTADTSVILVNAVFALENSCLYGFSPYVGGGIGAANIRLGKAKSIQVDPPEEGINHFNSGRHDSSWAFAAQVKAGLSYKICDSFHIFGEYRFLFVDTSNYIFGSTDYPDHAVTSPWNVRVKDSCFNAFAIGIQYDL